MVERIVIHIGVPKTGSTTIQDSLGKKKDLLQLHGFLYPEFNNFAKPVFNHSFILNSKFKKNPENILYNKVNKITTKERVELLNQKYDNQIINQISCFYGHTLIISGEDLSGFRKYQLKLFKSFLMSVTCREVKMQVMMFCRNPIKRKRSGIGELVKAGKFLSSLSKINLTDSSYYRDIISNFSEVFGQDTIRVFRYEDAIKHSSGPVGTLLDAIGGSSELLSQFRNERYNSGSTNEAITLLSAMNETLPAIDNIPFIVKGQTRKLLIHLPGQRFTLPVSFQRKYWEHTKDDVEWLCKTYSLPLYEFEEEKVPPIAEKWSEETLSYLRKVIGDMPDPVKKTILDVLLTEFKTHEKEFNFSKKRNLFKFIMFYSSYLQVGSRFNKLKYITRKLGLLSGGFFSFDYYLNTHKINTLNHK